MTIDIATVYVLRVNSQELRLIMSGLTGKMKPEWEQDAIALQDEIFKARNSQAKTAYNNISKLEDNL